MRIRAVLILLALLFAAAPLSAQAKEEGHGHNTSLSAEESAEVTAEFDEALDGLVHPDDEHGAASGGLPQFDPTWFPSQIFWLAVAFAFLYLFFSKKTLPEISSVIENRRGHIQHDLETAEHLTAEAEKVQAAYELSLEGAREKASAVIHDMETSLKEQTAQTYESFRIRSENDMRAAEKRIDAAQAAMMDEMRTVAAAAAATAVQKITGLQTDTQKARTVIDGLTGDLDRAA